MRPEARGQAWWWPAGPALCAGLVAVPALGPVALGPAGLAIPVAAVVFAVFFGVGMARDDWQSAAPTHPLEHLSAGLADVALFGTVAVALAAWSPSNVATAGLWAVAMLATLGGYRMGLVGIVVWAALIAGSGRLAADAAPWSLLEPTFTSWQTWLAAGASLGALAGWGAGQWAHVPEPQPGRSALPNLSAGLALFALLGGCIAVGAGWEAALGGPLSGAVRALMCACGAAGALALLLRAPTLGWRAAVGLAGFLATVWFTRTAGPWTWWAGELPLLLGVSAGLRAAHLRDVRWGLASVALVGSAALSFPEIPKMVLPAAATAVPLVLAVWFAGTRAVLRRPA